MAPALMKPMPQSTAMDHPLMKPMPQSPMATMPQIPAPAPAAAPTQAMPPPVPAWQQPGPPETPWQNPYSQNFQFGSAPHDPNGLWRAGMTAPAQMQGQQQLAHNPGQSYGGLSYLPNQQDQSGNQGSAVGQYGGTGGVRQQENQQRRQYR
jgi:hypothetical protein